MLPYVTKDNAKEIAKKAIESAGVGTTVVANPEGTATADLNKIGINNVIYNISTGGSQVVANPGGVLTDTLSSIAIDGVSYGIQGGASTSGDTLEIKGVLSRDEEEEETIITVSDEDTNKLIQFINSGKRNVKLLVGEASGQSQNYIIPLINCEKLFYEEDDADVLVCSFNLIEGEGQGMLCNLLVYFDREVKHSTGEVIDQGWYFSNAAMSNSFRVSNIHEGKGIDIRPQGSYGDYIINIDTAGAQTDQVLAYGSNGQTYWKTVSGGGSYTAGDGISIQNNTIEAKIDSNTLNFGSSGELRLKTGEGLTYDWNGVRLNISSYKGLSKGLTVNSNGLTIETSDHSLYGSDNYGLCVNVDPYRGLYTDNNGLGIKISGASSGDVLSYNGSNILWTKPGGALTKYEVNMETLLHATTNVQKLSKIKGNYYISYSGSTHNFGHISSWNDNGLYYIYDGSTSRAGVGSGGFSNVTVVYYNDSNLFE